ncbi:hypothetical protein [Varibaculum vaginae]|uniref:hypothetical protein n=1 Tax=Varibaculum vaginae TaxID=2364797 RepID=UPI000F080EB1|nr:hypothetical protein [Varibaculum vaginae]
MRVFKKAGLLAIVLLTALFASFIVAGNVAYAEDPPKISNHLYDPGNKMGSQANKVKERLASLDRSGLHVYVAFPSEYSNDTVSNWNLMALQKSGAPQGSYMLSIVADNPNQTMYLASADNAAKLSQEELSAIASDKMVPLLNQQKYPDAVLAYLDALSAKAPEMGLGLAVAPWAMIAFLVALILVIIVLSRMLKARRKAKERAEGKEQTDALISPATSGSVSETTPAPETQATQTSSALAAPEAENCEENERASKQNFGFKFGGQNHTKVSVSDSQTTQSASSPAPLKHETVTAATSPAPVVDIPSAAPQTPEVSTPSSTRAVPSQPLSAAATFQPQPGKVPSLAELDQIALARTKAASQGLSPAPHTDRNTAQSPQVSREPVLQETQSHPQDQTFKVQTPKQQSLSQSPQQIQQFQLPLPAVQAPASSPLATTAAPAAPIAVQPSHSPQMSAPQPHNSVLHPGATTYLPPQANDDDTQVTSASQIKHYGQERRDEIARAKAHAQAVNRFRQEQAKKPTSPVPQQPASSHPGASLPVTSSSPIPQVVTPAAYPISGKVLTPPLTEQDGSPISPVAPAKPEPVSLSSRPQTPPPTQQTAARGVAPTMHQPSQPAAQPALPPQETTPVKTQIAAQAIPPLSPQIATPSPRLEKSHPLRQPQSAALSSSKPTSNLPKVPQENPQVEPRTLAETGERPAAAGGQLDFTKVLRQADSWTRKGSSKLALAQERFGKIVTQPFALALVRAQDAVRAAFAEFATAQLQSRPIDQQIVAGNLPAPLRELRDQITHFTNLYHQQTPLPDITRNFERQIIECREDLVRCRLIVERIQSEDPQKATRIGEDVMGAHKLLARAQNLLEEAQTMDRAGRENEVLKATVRTENLLLQGHKIARQARAEEAAIRVAEKATRALTFEEKVEPLSEQVAILMAAVDDYIGVHTTQVGVAGRTMLDLANRTLTRLDRPGSLDTQEALRLLQRAKQQTEQALRLAENDVAKRS